MALFDQPDSMSPTSNAHLHPTSTFQHYCYKTQIWYLLTALILCTLLPFLAISLPTTPFILHVHPSWSFTPRGKKNHLAQPVCLEQLCAHPLVTLANLSLSSKLQLYFEKFLTPLSLANSPCYISATREPNNSFWEVYLNVFCQSLKIPEGQGTVRVAYHIFPLPRWHINYLLTKRLLTVITTAFLSTVEYSSLT